MKYFSLSIQDSKTKARARFHVSLKSSKAEFFGIYPEKVVQLALGLRLISFVSLSLPLALLSMKWEETRTHVRSPHCEFSWRCNEPEAVVATHCHKQASKQLHSERHEWIPSFCADAGRQSGSERWLAKGTALRGTPFGNTVVSHEQVLSSYFVVLFSLSPAWAPLVH